MEYLKLTECYSNLESTSKRLEKTNIISNFLKELKKDSEIEPIINLLKGRVFPPWDQRKIGVSDKIIIKALATSTGNSSEKIEKLFAKLGDLGLVAEQLTKDTQQLTLKKINLTSSLVYNEIKKLADLEGDGTVNKKVGVICELLTSATPIEAKFITRTILEQLRIGVADGIIREAIVWCFFHDKLKITYDQKSNELNIPDDTKIEYEKYIEKIQHGYNLTNDFAEVFKIVKEEGITGLDKITLKAGKPLNVMLFQRASNLNEAFESIGKILAFEYKFDGFRLQCHCNNGKITLYTRRLENVTKQFPDVVEILKKGIKADNYILDAEAVGIDPKTKNLLPFQAISQRIRRKYDIEELSEKIPVNIFVFDIMSYNNESLLDAAFSRRRHIIEKIVLLIPNKLSTAKQIVTDKLSNAETFYKESLEAGNEGVMAKSLTAIYKPGSRVGFGMKIKPILETLDLIIVKADYGEGKRTGMISSYTVACSSNGKLLEIGKVSTGLKEKEDSEEASFPELTKLLKPLIKKQDGKELIIEPKIVIEVGYEEIQKSNEYSSGYGLRFPKVLKIRYDLSIDDINNLEDVEKIYLEQRGRNK